ncbi:MAG: protein phosphatase 2C domain-containing protein, partial [Bryobacteraceae bacterium]
MVKTRLKCAALSDPGLVRKNNEDAFHIDPDRGIFLVVDGIGGQAAGEKAAEIAVDRIRSRLERQTGTTEQRIREAIAVANNEIFRAAQRNPDWHGMA